MAAPLLPPAPPGLPPFNFGVGLAPAVDDEQLITLQANDDSRHEIRRGAAKLSGLLRELIGHLPDLADATPVPLYRLDGPTLTSVIEWMEHHWDEEEEEMNESATTAPHQLEIRIGQWDQYYLDQGDLTVLRVLADAANYLRIPRLVTLCNHSIADRIGRAQNTRELRQALAEDPEEVAFSPDDSVQIRNENDWAMDVPESEDWKATGILTEDTPTGQISAPYYIEL